MSQIVLYIIANLSWRFHVNLLIRFTVILLKKYAEAPRRNTVKSLGRRDTVWRIISQVVPSISWKFPENLFTRFFQNITNKHRSRK